MTNRPASYVEKMNALRNQFEEDLPNKIEMILKKWQGLQNNRLDWDLFEDLYISIHKLSGASGTFGLMEISEISSKIENIMRKELEIKKPLNARKITQIDHYIQDLNQYGGKKTNNNH